MHSALFSPAKYGILPELIAARTACAGNGLLEMWTFLAILGGTAAGGLLLFQAGESIMARTACVGRHRRHWIHRLWSVPHVQAARADGGLVATLSGAWSALRADRMLRLAITEQCFFWTIASLFAQNILVYAKAVLGLSDAWRGSRSRCCPSASA